MKFQITTKAARVHHVAIEAVVRNRFQRDRSKYGVWLAESLAAMGPTYVKLGQLLSTRTDMFEKPILQELTRLQDRTPAVSFKSIEAMIPDDVFTDIDPHPLASASIGQVHRAKYRGEDVVIKVRKPNIDKRVGNDLLFLRQCVAFLRITRHPRYAEMKSIVSQVNLFLEKELDYSQEVNNLLVFKSMLMTGVMIPKVYPEVCTPNMIVMEYTPSTKITDIELMAEQSISTSLLAKRLFDLYLKMIVVHGAVNIDPHPGNIGVIPVGKDDFRIVMYDFGNITFLSPNFKAKVKNLLMSVYERDPDDFVDLLTELRIIVSSSPNKQLNKEEAKALFALLFSYLQNMDIDQLKDAILQQQIFRDGASFQFNQEFLSLFRVFLLLDRTCIHLDPGFNYFECLKPYTNALFQDPSFYDYKSRRDISKLLSVFNRIDVNTKSLSLTNTKVDDLMRTDTITRLLLLAAVMLNLFI